MEVLANNCELLVHSTDMFPVEQKSSKVDPLISRSWKTGIRRWGGCSDWRIENTRIIIFILGNAFIIIPLLMILYYGLTDKNGSFTLNNLSQMTTPENLKRSDWLFTVVYQHFNLLSPRLSTGYDSCREKYESTSFYRTDIHSSDVDEFSSSDISVADTFGKTESLTAYLISPSSGAVDHQYSICHCSRNGIQFSSFYGTSIYNVLSKIDKDVIHAARDLGANTAQTFLRS